jgi:hypothetical protein
LEVHRHFVKTNPSQQLAGRDSNLGAKQPAKPITRDAELLCKLRHAMWGSRVGAEQLQGVPDSWIEALCDQWIQLRQHEELPKSQQREFRV